MYTEDYYTLLGISKNASSDDIRQAYRKAARKFHPDVNKGAGAEEKFKAIGEAYEVLKDEKKRKLYDQFGSRWREAEAGYTESGKTGRGYGYSKGNHYYSNGESFAQSEDLNDILSQLFGKADSFGAQHEGGWQQYGWGQEQPTEYQLQVSIEDLYFGAVKHISLPTLHRDGNGVPHSGQKEIKVTIPKGVKDGSVIRLGGGKSGEGQIHIRLQVVPHDRYSLDGYNLKTIVAVSPWELLLGAKVPVRTINGEIKVSIPARSQNGRQLRVQGKGLPIKNGSSGDLIVVLEVRLPREVTEKEESLWKELAKLSIFEPRKEQQQRPAPQVVV